ncbi:hypothetical protein O7543_19225 [Solwaraspora sp. WMMA2080]|uniref:hypothetical protein n=1 Tax=unclassified Solwaraspora TaxID=2627926 RepID=UPI00248C2492|nr:MULTISPECIES: hypothetical protein [unclassified Solwaraspora]WBB97089.1 hypothetical protein O7553_28145 [Solwaraspora sp. WMMA2059]WBC19009.1 hypothetical protein O7543_19225 [Solwaraspora sp. WMMA2080]
MSAGDQLWLPGHQCAALTAPVVDRVHRAAMAAADTAGAELRQRYGGPAAVGYLVDLRTRLAAPAGLVDAAGFAAVTRYQDAASCQRVLDKQVAYGMLVRHPDGALRATERGGAFLTDLYGLHATVTGQIWGAEHAARLARLVELTGRLLAAALAGTGDAGPDTDTGGQDAFRAVAPPYEPEGTPAGVLLLNRLTVLRYHRADAHAAAWTAAGHTARSIVDLPPGPARLAIEQETDRRAAGPYQSLEPEQRLMLLADLAALPG